MLKNIKPSFRKICCNFIIGAFFCTSFVSVANADICFVLDQDCIDNGTLKRMTEENSLCSGYDETTDISTSNNGLKCDRCNEGGMSNKGGMIKYKCYCKEDTLVREGDHCVYKNDTVCPVADYYFDADRGAGWDCDACIDHRSEQYGKYKCNCDGDHLDKNGTCVEDACLFLKGKELVNNSTVSSRENQNWVCQKCTASSSQTIYYNKAHCECDGEAWGEYCIPAGRCVASQGYYNTSNIQCGTGDVVKRMDSGHYKGCYYCADDDSDKCPSPYTKRQEEACRGKNGWYTIETDVTSTKGYPCFTCRQYQCNEEEGYYYFESQCKKHYNISWMDNFDRMWAAVVNNLIPIKDALAAVSQKAINAQNLQLVNDGVGGYIVAVGGGTGGRDCPCPKSGPGSGQYYGKDSSGRDMYYDLSPCCTAITEQPITNDDLRLFVDGILDNERVLDEVVCRKYSCFENSTTKCWHGKIINADICTEGSKTVDCAFYETKTHVSTNECGTKCYACKCTDDSCTSGELNPNCGMGFSKINAGTTHCTNTQCYNCTCTNDACSSGELNPSCGDGFTKVNAGTTYCTNKQCYSCTCTDDSCTSGELNPSCSYGRSNAGKTKCTNQQCYTCNACSDTCSAHGWKSSASECSYGTNTKTDNCGGTCYECKNAPVVESCPQGYSEGTKSGDGWDTTTSTPNGTKNCYKAKSCPTGYLPYGAITSCSSGTLTCDGGKTGDGKCCHCVATQSCASGYSTSVKSCSNSSQYLTCSGSANGESCCKCAGKCDTSNCGGWKETNPGNGWICCPSPVGGGYCCHH